MWHFQRPGEAIGECGYIVRGILTYFRYLGNHITTKDSDRGGLEQV